MAKYEVIGNVYVHNKQYVGTPNGDKNPIVEMDPEAAGKAVAAGNLKPIDAAGKKSAKDEK